jgi:hypothetical protein
VGNRVDPVTQGTGYLEVLLDPGFNRTLEFPQACFQDSVHPVKSFFAPPIVASEPSRCCGIPAALAHGRIGAGAAGLVRPRRPKNALVMHHALHDREQMIDEDIDRRIGSGRALAKEKIIVGEAPLQHVTAGNARRMEEIGIAEFVVERQLSHFGDPDGADIPDSRGHGATAPEVLDRGRDRAGGICHRETYFGLDRRDGNGIGVTCERLCGGGWGLRKRQMGDGGTVGHAGSPGSSGFSEVGA